MLPYILAIAIAIYSLILFAQAFFSPVIHRKDDFLWSGIGLFYALVLWLCAGRITGAVLLGETAATILLISFGWQTLKLRRAIAYPDQPSVEFSVMEWVQNRFSSIGRKKSAISPPPQSVTPSNKEITPQEISQPTISQETQTPILQENEETLASPSLTVTEDKTTETVAEEILETAIEENIKVSITVEPETEDEDIFGVTEVAQPETIGNETPKTLTEFPKKATVEDNESKSTQPKTAQKQRFSFKNIFGLGKKRPTPTQSTIKPTSETVTKASKQAESENEQWDTPQPTAETTTSKEAPSPTVQQITETILQNQSSSTPENKDEPSLPEVTPENSSENELETFIPDEMQKTVIESDGSQQMTSEDSFEDELETFIPNEMQETVIESDESESNPAELEEKKVSSAKPIETKETQQPTDKNESEVKDEKLDQTE